MTIDQTFSYMAIVAVGIVVLKLVVWGFQYVGLTEKTTRLEREYSKKVEQLEKHYSEMKANNEAELESELNELQEKIFHFKSEFSNRVTDELVKGYEDSKLTSPLPFPSVKLQGDIIQLDRRIKDMIKDNAVIIQTSQFKDKPTETRFKKSMIRAFSTEVELTLGKTTSKNYERSYNKIADAFESINKTYMPLGLTLNPALCDLMIEKLNSIYSFMVNRESEKADEKAERERIKEEQEVQKEIDLAKQKIEKDETHCRNEIKKLLLYIKKTDDLVQVQLYKDKIEEIEEKLDELDQEKQGVINREKNARAGFVYVISNIGSFGDDVFKIGMSRRLNPMTRIDELSSASVPFPFDVHAMIFSDDAPSLENTLHKYFEGCRVNKVNQRKEFFRTTIDEIKDVVLKNHNSTVNFIDFPVAEEYRATLEKENEA